MTFRAVLFDLDGTLLDTLADIADATNRVLASEMYPTHHLDAYRYFIGDGMEKLVLRALPEEHRDEATLKSMFKRVRDEYFNNWAVKTSPYEGIPELLEHLERRDVAMTVLSNKINDVTIRMIPHFFPDRHFKVVLGARPNHPKKPDPTVALEIAERVGIAPDEFLYLGDTATDMKTARGAGMYPAGAVWGFRTRDELLENGAEAVLDHPLDLIHRGLLDH